MVLCSYCWASPLNVRINFSPFLRLESGWSASDSRVANWKYRPGRDSDDQLQLLKEIMEAQGPSLCATQSTLLYEAARSAALEELGRVHVIGTAGISKLYHGQDRN